MCIRDRCTEDYKIPDTNLVIPKGTPFVIPVYAIHHDPEYYPDPYKFDPERFMNDATKTKNNFTFMPFGEGPRMCIGEWSPWEFNGSENFAVNKYATMSLSLIHI